MITEYYINVIEDLTRDLSSTERYQRLLRAIRHAIPCDAIVLLQLSGQTLKPIVFEGLQNDIAGRRFELGKHPRLDHIVNNRQVVRFESDSPLPDPYDGLVDTPDGELHVHDCMGFSIYIADEPWGIITLDAMRPGQFADVDLHDQRIAISMTRAVVTAAQRIASLEQRLSHGFEVTAELNREHGPDELIGRSKAINNLTQEIKTVADSPLTVLLQGETGVGKEVIARQIHLTSSRFDKPLVQINCAALPDNLAEAELFGHTKGAFTGAHSARSGRFELANHGTLFLDEVGELPLPLQAKLLRAIQEGEVQRLGSDQIISVDVRIIAATNRHLQQEVKEGRFRADLYHRLSVYPIFIPPLKERENDVLLLAEYFLEKNQWRLNIPKLVLTTASKNLLLTHSWPGNVRELEHVLSRAALKAKSGGNSSDIVFIEPSHLDLATQPVTATNKLSSLTDVPRNNLSLKSAIDRFQAELIQETIARHHNNLSSAAKELGVNRSNLFRLCKRLGIK